jgi:hypothetical protein
VAPSAFSAIPARNGGQEPQCDDPDERRRKPTASRIWCAPARRSRT